MSRLALVLGCLVLLAPHASAQGTSHLFTRPALPSKDALDRLGLKLMWYKKIPMDGLKDGIASLQLLELFPEKVGKVEPETQYEMLIQTRSGLVQLMDAENGDLKWRTPVGLPYKYFQGAAFNKYSVYVTREARLFALNRATGKHRLFSLVDITGIPVLGTPILSAPSAPIFADVAAVFVPSINRITGYVIPPVKSLTFNLGSPKPSQIIKITAAQVPPPVKFQGTIVLEEQSMTRPLVMFGETLGVYTNNGVFYSINKYKLQEKSHYATYGPALAGVSSYGKMAYFGSADFNVYAVNMTNNKLRWRFLSGSPVVRTPQPTDTDVFVTTIKSGLCRLDRDDGRLIWKNPQADRFLATNGKFVYALDDQRFLLVIDYLKGVTMSRYDLSDYLVSYSNTTTDRIYLAGHDGSIICLRHQKFQKPYLPNTGEADGME